MDFKEHLCTLFIILLPQLIILAYSLYRYFSFEEENEKHKREYERHKQREMVRKARLATLRPKRDFDSDSPT